ncbi:MAG: substrate-binding domain-containing protein, partial [Ilumatobacteraceae bacterium]
DTRTMDRVTRRGARQPRVFARNRLAIAVEPGNPLGVRGLTDLARDDLVVVLADADVPAGAYAAQVLEAAGVDVRAASYEANVKAVASKVALGEADAGIVYRTDIAADPSALSEVDIPDEQNIVADYPIVGLTDRDDVASFVEFVLSSSGRAALTDAGFDAP